ncbi:MAG: YqgE/AlgH family protein [Solirubrobacteraceae bacterium]
MAPSGARTKLLVAAPDLLDPSFQRTVVLVAEHTEEGAMGVVLNRPSGTTVGEASPDLAALAEADDYVHVGGPMQPNGVIVLAEFDDPVLAASIVLGDVGFVSAGSDLDEVARDVRRTRVFAGHAGWGPGQLDSELEDEGWIVVEAPRPDELFTEDPESLWSEVLDRKGGRYKLVARMPADPSVN